jgi:hypothetical protein
MKFCNMQNAKWKMENDTSQQSGGLSYANKSQPDTFARYLFFSLHFEKQYDVVSLPSH